MLYGGYSYGNKKYTVGEAFDPGYSLSDDAIKARAALKKFKPNYQGIKPGQYLIKTAEGMDESARTAFVNGKLGAIAETQQPNQALRIALDKLGEAGEVAKKAAEAD